MTTHTDSCQGYTPPPLNFGHPQQLPADWYIPLALCRYDYLVAHDTEYVQKVDRNVVLSHQLFVVDPHSKTYNDIIIFVADDARKTLNEIFAAALKSFGIGYKRASDTSIYLLQHFGLAELSCLKDRAFWLDTFVQVRNCPVSTTDIKTKADFGNRNSANIKVKLQDTMLHAATGNSSLKSISTACNAKKVEIGEYINKMDVLLEENRELYIEYACTDTRVTLEYELRFLASFEHLNKLTGGKAKPSRTLGGCAVNLLENFINTRAVNGGPTFQQFVGKTENKELEIATDIGLSNIRCNKPSRLASEPFASLSYFGGVNVAYVHNTIKCTDEQIIVDLDFVSAYPTTYSVQETIDYNIATIHLHSINKIVKAHMHPERGVPHIYAFVDFDFPPETQFPCIPVSGAYGLVHPLSGCRVPATGVEIALAVAQGADVRLSGGEAAIQLPPLLNDKYAPDTTFADFFALLIAERRRHPKNTITNLTCKEICNSLYGKTAQGIRYRLLPSTKKPLPASKITLPAYAATCTGLVRAALLATVQTLSMFEGVQCLSATTDGGMFVIPKPKGLVIQTDSAGIVVPPRLQDVLSTEMLDAVHSQYPVAAMREGIKRLALHDTYALEIKHVGDTATTYKTRAYHMKFKGIEQFKAKGGLKAATADEMYQIALCDDRVLREYHRLPSYEDLKSNKYKDLINIKCINMAALDLECKRIFSNDGNVSRPPKDIAEIFRYRRAITNLHKHGKQAKPLVLAVEVAKIEHPKTLRGTTEHQILLMVITAIVRGVTPWRRGRRPYEELATIFGVSLDRIKRCKKSPLNKVAPCNEFYKKSVREIARKIGILRLTRGMYNAILYDV